MRYILKAIWIEGYDRGRGTTTPAQANCSVRAVCTAAHEGGQPCPSCFGKSVSAVPEGARLLEDTGFVRVGRVISRQCIYED